MRTTKNVYRVFVSLLATTIVAGWASTRVLAQDLEGPGASSGSSLPTLNGRSAGFELETPAEAGAQPIPTSYVLPLPHPVPPFPILLNLSFLRYASHFITPPS